MSMQASINAEHTLSHTPEQLAELYHAQQHFFNSGVTRPYEFRKGQLRVLYHAIKRHESKLLKAFEQDLRKSELEG